MNFFRFWLNPTEIPSHIQKPKTSKMIDYRFLMERLLCLLFSVLRRDNSSFLASIQKKNEERKTVEKILWRYAIRLISFACELYA